MKHLLIGIGILLLCLALCLTVSAVLHRYTEQVAVLLEQSLEEAESGNWQSASRCLADAQAFWESHRGFWGVALRHAEVDAADSTLTQLAVQLRSRSEDFAVTCADLIRQIRHLARSEWPAYYNIL